MVERTILEQLIHIEDAGLKEKICQYAEIHHYRKNEHLYEIGYIQEKVYIIIDGVLQRYFIDETQEEFTECFMMERGMVANSYNIFLKETGFTPSIAAVRSLTDSYILELPVEDVFLLLQQSLELSKVYVKYLWESLEYHNEINKHRLQLDNTQRYQWFCKKWPEVDKIASNHQISTFLGIRSESLSRLRKRKSESETCAD